MASENDSNESSTRIIREKDSASVQRRKSLKRKEAARRNLIDSIYTRTVDVRHSGPCLSNDRGKAEVKFPRVNSRESSVKNGSYFPGHSDSVRGSYKTVSPNSLIEIVNETSRSDIWTRNGLKIRKSSGHNISLPEIIMEFNMETNNVTSGPRALSPETEIPEDERALGAPYEDYLQKKKYNSFNPCRSKYRPVTPGLLDSLNKLKVPSKVKTEQWVRSSQKLQKPLYGHVYRTENIDTSNSAFPNWIYSD